ncbi:MAG: hypothetical protein JWQ40_5027 [Segetibacter sp.]|nr:hypothetical protein [Segetibacter sp.]
MNLKYTPLLFSRPNFLIAFLFVSASVNAQLTLAGGTIRISDGASIVCNGSVTNTSGTIINDGKLETHGSFINHGTYNSTANGDSLLLTDTGTVQLSTGSSFVNNLLVNKTNGGSVTLAGITTVKNKFDFIAGRFSTDPLTAYEFTAPASATFSFAAGTEIVGKVRRTAWINETSVMFNQPNMKLTTHGGTAPTAILVSMIPNGNPSATEREVSRSFSVNATGGTGNTADITFPYKNTELNSNTENNLIPWFYSSNEWVAKMTGNTITATSDFITTTGIDIANLNKEWKLADPKYTFNVTTLLKGAWNGSAMSTSLNAAGLLPLAQPYNTAPYNYTGTESVTAIPNANIVDWVLLELRKPASGLPADATPSTIVGRKAAFLTKTGSIVDLDGATPAWFNIIKQGASFVVVRHRNHLSVMSNAVSLNTDGTIANDFSLLDKSYKDASAPGNPMVLLPGGTKYGLWAGDVNKDGVVSVTDVNAVKLAIANSSVGYQPSDVDLSNSITVTDVNLTKLTIASSGSTSSAARQAEVIVKSNVPQ